jgi:C1A family cysteine protease
MSASRFLLAVLVVGSAVLCTAAAPRALAAAAAAMASRHEKWMAEHGRAYKDEAEKARRLEEFRGARTGLGPRPAPSAGAGRFRYENFSLADAAQSVDWRAMGAVTGVKDQGACGTYLRTRTTMQTRKHHLRTCTMHAF